MKLINKYCIRNLARYSLVPMMAAFGLAAHAQQSQSSQPSQPSGTESKSTETHTHGDTKFIKRAAWDNLQEIELGKLGQQKAQNQQLKDFSKQLEQDHASANAKLQPIAQNLNVQWPQQLPSRWQSEITKLQKLNGADFDKEFATYLLRDHARDMDSYQREANRTQNADLKSYAQNMHQAMQSHFQTVESLAKTVGVDQKTIAGILKRHPEATGGMGTPTGKEKGSSSGSTWKNEKSDKSDASEKSGGY